MNNKVSIITANYNGEKYIIDTIKSVLSQTHKNWEMIIIDDASSDNSCNIINNFCKKDKRIRFIKLEQNSGPAVTRNKGIELANGRYITFIDNDDLWHKNFLQTMVSFIEKNNITFAYASYERKNESLEKDFGTFIVPEKVSYYDILKSCPISCLTAMYDTSKIGKMYMPNILKRQDYGLWLRILKKVKYAYGVKTPLAIYRIRPNSVSRNKLKAASYQWKIYRDVEKFSLIKCCYYFVNYAINGIIKYGS